jgi:hypothetical protein
MRRLSGLDLARLPRVAPGEALLTWDIPKNGHMAYARRCSVRYKAIKADEMPAKMLTS